MDLFINSKQNTKLGIYCVKIIQRSCFYFERDDIEFILCVKLSIYE
jgi:hypothetical protein